MKPETYRRRPTEVTAVRFDLGKEKEIAEWCNGLIILNEDYLIVIEPCSDRRPLAHCARPGHWIVRESTGRFSVYSDERFQQEFEPANATQAKELVP